MKRLLIVLMTAAILSSCDSEESGPSLSSLLPSGIEIFVSDAAGFSAGNFKILKYDPVSNTTDVYINSNLDWPQDIVFLENQGVVLVSNLNSNKITKYKITDGSYLGDFAVDLSGPTRMKVGEDGYLYVAQWNGNKPISRYNLDGSFKDEFTSSGISQAIGMDWDADGKLYVSSFGGGYINYFDVDGEDLGRFTTEIQGPTNIWFDQHGNLNVLDWTGDNAKQFDSQGKLVKTLIPKNLLKPEGILEINENLIAIGDGGTSSVKLFDYEGNYVMDLIKSKTAGLQNPNAVIARIK
ncbi:MAG: hypothetical protein RLO81_08445 [Fulvivirga sp.]|uniref:Vgb family protein n=1 Tax=Fulvivirga sp. TaxID=1931237 RepID=UPI0032ED33C1